MSVAFFHGKSTEGGLQMFAGTDCVFTVELVSRS